MGSKSTPKYFRKVIQGNYIDVGELKEETAQNWKMLWPTKKKKKALLTIKLMCCIQSHLRPYNSIPKTTKVAIHQKSFNPQIIKNLLIPPYFQTWQVTGGYKIWEPKGE